MPSHCRSLAGLVDLVISGSWAVDKGYRPGALHCADYAFGLSAVEAPGVTGTGLCPLAGTEPFSRDLPLAPRGQSSLLAPQLGSLVARTP